MRRIRKFLPPTFKRDKDNVSPAYTDGRMTVEVRIACSWGASKKEKDSCHVSRIVARPAYPYRNSRINNRSWGPRKDHTFNWDGIATRLQMMIPLCDNVEAELKKWDQDLIDHKAAQVKARKHAAKMLKRNKLPEECSSSWGTKELGEGIHLSVGVSGANFNLNINYVPAELAEEILAMVASVGLKEEEEDDE